MDVMLTVTDGCLEALDWWQQTDLNIHNSNKFIQIKWIEIRFWKKMLFGGFFWND